MLTILAALWVPPVANQPHESVSCRDVPVGVLPLELEVGGARVRFVEWVMDREDGATVGFTAVTRSPVRFEARAGERVFASASRWVHPTLQPLDGLRVCSIDG